MAYPASNWTFLSPESSLTGEAAVIVYANWFQCGRSERIVSPCVYSRMLLWCRAGAGTVTVNNDRFALQAEDYLLLPWGHSVSYQADAADPFYLGGVHIIPDHDRNHPVDFRVAHSREESVARHSWRRDDLQTATPSVIRGSFTWASRLRLLATYIVERYVQEPPAQEPMRQLAGLLLTELASAVVQRSASTIVPPTSLNRMQLFIRDHLAAPLTVGAIAAVGGCSAATAHRLFKTHLGQTPYGYVLQVRMEAAQQLLRTTGRPVTDVARQVGFDDPYYFSRAFKRTVGASPRHYRAALPQI